MEKKSLRGSMEEYNCFITEIKIKDNILYIYWHDRVNPLHGIVKISQDPETKEILIDSAHTDKRFVLYLLQLMVQKGKFK